MAEKGAQAFGTTILAAGTALEGDLRVRGEVLIDGAVAGSIAADGALAIGPAGRILGEVRCGELSLRGRIDGIVRTRGLLRVFSSGYVQGHASYDSLEIERGGVLAGSAFQALPTDELSDEWDD